MDLELSLVEVKENLRKAESGPVTLGTAVDTTHLENTSPKVCSRWFWAVLTAIVPVSAMGMKAIVVVLSCSCSCKDSSEK